MGGFIDDEPGAGEIAGPTEAGWNPINVIRDGIRATTVLLMKDRAGRVGGTGVGADAASARGRVHRDPRLPGRAFLWREGCALGAV